MKRCVDGVNLGANTHSKYEWYPWSGGPRLNEREKMSWELVLLTCCLLPD